MLPRSYLQQAGMTITPGTPQKAAVAHVCYIPKINKEEFQTTNINDVIAHNGYLIDKSTGEKIVWYECAPSKNTECSKSLCRTDEAENEPSFGFCSKTADERFRKDGGKAWYAVRKTPEDGEPYWGREYIEGA